MQFLSSHDFNLFLSSYVFLTAGFAFQILIQKLVKTKKFLSNVSDYYEITNLVYNFFRLFTFFSIHFFADLVFMNFFASTDFQDKKILIIKKFRFVFWNEFWSIFFLSKFSARLNFQFFNEPKMSQNFLPLITMTN